MMRVLLMMITWERMINLERRAAFSIEEMIHIIIEREREREMIQMNKRESLPVFLLRNHCHHSSLETNHCILLSLPNFYSFCSFSFHFPLSSNIIRKNYLKSQKREFTDSSQFNAIPEHLHEHQHLNNGNSFKSVFINSPHVGHKKSSFCFRKRNPHHVMSCFHFNMQMFYLFQGCMKSI